MGWARTSNDLCEEEKVHGLVDCTGTILVRVIVLVGLIRGGEASCLRGRGANVRVLEHVAVVGVLLVTRSCGVPSVGKSKGTRS